MGRKRAKQKRQDLRKGGRVNKFMGGFAEPNLEQLEAAVQENLRRDRLGLAPSLPGPSTVATNTGPGFVTGRGDTRDRYTANIPSEPSFDYDFPGFPGEPGDPTPPRGPRPPRGPGTPPPPKIPLVFDDTPPGLNLAAVVSPKSAKLPKLPIVTYSIVFIKPPVEKPIE